MRLKGPKIPRKPTMVLMVLLLLIQILAVFLQVKDFPFINFDDQDYVFRNSHVLGGLTREGLAWAFKSVEFGNWHPLTWLSHMVDISLFGVNPGAHHLVNVAIHALNTSLLLLILSRLTGEVWPSFMVASLFAIHPLHVESVAWIAERKDVLSTFFWLLTIRAYIAYAKRETAGSYLWVALFLGLALLAKPMAVTLPFILLLLDNWPLGRTRTRSVFSLVLEKVPLFAFSAVSCIVTLMAQAKAFAIASPIYFPVGMRIENTLVAYAAYIGKTVWPVSLAVFYPHPGSINAVIPVWEIGLAVSLLGTISGLVVWQLRCRPYFATGWFWYLGTLLPVIGLIQVGGQAMADRYTYVPLIGIFIMIAWGTWRFTEKRKLGRVVLGIASGVTIATLIFVARVQADSWKSSVSLFSHAVEVVENNWSAWNNLGFSYMEQEQYDNSIPCFKEAVRIRPLFGEAWYNLGSAYEETAQTALAIEAYLESIRIRPNEVMAMYRLGFLYATHGQRKQFLEIHRRIQGINPIMADSLMNMCATML